VLLACAQPPTPVSEADTVAFPDPNLEAAIRQAIGKPAGSIRHSDLEDLTVLSASSAGITDLTGLEHCTSLTHLCLSGKEAEDGHRLCSLDPASPDSGSLSLSSRFRPHGVVTIWAGRLSDITPLSNLTNLRALDLSQNQIRGLAPLSNLTNLTQLDLMGNEIRDLSALRRLANLTELSLGLNWTPDVSALTGLTNLTRLNLESSGVGDVSALSNLTGLTLLDLSDNGIADIAPLRALTQLTELDISWNEIGDA
jgi:internalin A